METSEEFQLSSPVLPATPPPALTTAKKSRVWMRLVIGLVIVAGLGGGGYFAYSRGYISIPFLTPKSDELVDTMFESLEQIKNAQYGVRVSFKTEPHQPAYKPFFSNSNNQNTNNVFDELLTPSADTGILSGLLALYNPETILEILPSDVVLEGGSTFYIESDVPTKDAEALMSVDGTYTGSDISVAFDVEMRKIDSTVYGVIRKFPSLGGFFDVATIKEKWVEIKPDDTEFFTEDALETVDSKKAAENIRRSLKQALDKKVFTVKNKKGRDTIAGARADRYDVELDPAQLPAVYQTIIDEKRDRGENVEELEKFVTALKKPEVQQFLQGIVDNTTFEIWIDVAKGYLRQVHWKLVVVPPASNERLKDKQVAMDITFTLDKVNQKVNVNRPSPTISYDEAARLVTGVSVEEQQFNKQIDRVANIRSALRTYQNKQGSYPATLEELTIGLKKMYDDCKTSQAVNANKNVNASVVPSATNGSNTNFTIEEVGSEIGLGEGSFGLSCYTYERYKNGFSTTDIYTNKPYGYSVNGEDYQLTHEMRLSDSLEAYNKDNYAEGKNTATSKDVSVEKVSKYEETKSTVNINTSVNTNTSSGAINNNTNNPVVTNTPVQNTNISFVDSDGDGIADSSEITTYFTNPNDRDTDADGLSDYLEVVTCQTSPTKADTDGDSYTDKTEVLNGFNPKGPGVATSTLCKEGYDLGK